MVHSTPVGARGRLIPARNIKKTSEKQQELVRDENANISAEKKLGAAEVVVLRKRWQSLDTGNGGEDQQTGNGMIVCLLQQGLTLREIRAVLGCGKNRILRIRRELRDPSLKKKKKKPVYYHVTEEQKEEIKRHLRTYETEYGFSCSHRRQRKYLVAEGITWKKI